jgi:hypothetical protein
MDTSSIHTKNPKPTCVDDTAVLTRTDLPGVFYGAGSRIVNAACIAVEPTSWLGCFRANSDAVQSAGC